MDVSAAYGDTVTLRVEAIGPDLQYKWQKLGKGSFFNTTVGVKETLPLSDLGPDDAGRYHVVVTSPGYGSVTSREFTIAFPTETGIDRIRTVKQPGNARSGAPVGRGVALNGRFFYPGYDPDSGVELWSTDGTAAGTRRVKDIQPGSGNGMIVVKGSKASLGVHHGRLYFTGDDGQNGRVLWVSDGTAAGTQPLGELRFVDEGYEGPWIQGFPGFSTIRGREAKLHSAIDLEVTDFTSSGDLLFFRAASSGQAMLGRTDGSAHGTYSVMPVEVQVADHWGDLCPICPDSMATVMIAFTDIQSITSGPAGQVFFVGTTEKYGRELWASRGDWGPFFGGTDVVKDINPGSVDGILAANLTPHQGKVFFMAQDGSTGQEPWVSDGTQDGTKRLGDIHPGGPSSLAFEFTVFSGEVYFTARSATSQGLWKTDGTLERTVLVKEFLGGPSRLRAAHALVGTDRLYFMARDADSGFELWQTPGTSAGIFRVGDIVPGTGWSSPRPLGTDQGALFFLTEAPESARALWRTDGTEAGTVRLTPSAAVLKHALLRAGSDTYFATYKQEGGREFTIYRTGGTAASTTALAVIPYVGSPELQWADLGPRKLLNTAAVATSDFRTGDFLVTDGTPAGTELLNLPAWPGTFGGLTPFHGGLLFTAMLDEHTSGLYRSDGLTLTLLKTYPADTARSWGASGDSRALFAPQSSGWQQAGLITTDGTAAGTKLLPFAYDPSHPAGLSALGNSFVLSGGVHGFTDLDEDLYDGGNGVTHVKDSELYGVNSQGQLALIKAIVGNASIGSNPSSLIRLGNHIYFFVDGPWGSLVSGLWKTDGTALGTAMVEPLMAVGGPFTPGSEVFRPGILSDRLYFGADSETLLLGVELWKSSGTPLGTVHLKDIYPGKHLDQSETIAGSVTVAVPNSSHPAEFTAVGSTLFFAATGPKGRELWKTDGTAAGTVMVRDLSTGDEEVYDSTLSFIYGLGNAIAGGDGVAPASVAARNVTNPTNLVAVAGKLYFVARDPEGTKLFRSDGTATGTVPIESLRSLYGPPRELTSLNDRLYYVRGALALRPQLWEYDPATDTHRAITSLAGGLPQPAQLTVSEGRLYFVGDDGTGQKLLVYERVPFIKEHPASQTVLAGASATFQVVTRDADLAYAWRSGILSQVGVLGTNSTLTIPASEATGKPYSVRVTKPGSGSQNSHAASLTVLNAASSKNIQQHPDRWWTLDPADSGPAGPGTPGTIDPAWGVSNMVVGTIARIKNLAGGKILIGGQFTTVAGVAVNSLARLNHDGTLDPTFDAGTGPAGGMVDLAVQSDGKIMIAGAFLTVDGYQRERVARLHSDGAVDLDFKPAISQTGLQAVLSVLPAPNGQVYVGGIFEAWDGHPTVSVARLNPNGSVDTTFSVRNQPNVGGPFRVAAMAWYPSETDPQWLLVGGGNYYVEPGNGVSNLRRHIARLDPLTGAWDTTFNLTPIPNPPASVDGSVSMIVPLADGKILVSGVQGGGHTGFDGMLRLNANGTLDTTFQAGPTESGLGPATAASPFRTFAVLPGGQIVAGGRFTKVQHSGRSNIVQLLPNGASDPSFSSVDGPNNEVTAVAVQSDGGLLIAGQFTKVGGVARAGMARLHGNPSPPVFVLNSATPLLSLGDRFSRQATLKVEVLGSPAPTVTWYRGSHVVGNGPVLTLDRSMSDLEGDYYASVENPSGVVITDPIAIKLDSGPPVITSPPQDASVTWLGTGVFRVEASGALPIDYQWKRNGEPMAGETNPVLRVKALKLDAGKDAYSVAVKNPAALVESPPARLILSQGGMRNPCFYHYTLPAGLDDQSMACALPTAYDFPDYAHVESIAYLPSGHVVLGGGVFTRGSKWSTPTAPYLMRLTEWGVSAFEGDERPDAVVHVVAGAPDSSVYIAGDFKNIVDSEGNVLHARRWVAKFDAQMRFVPGFAPEFLPMNSEVTALRVQPDGKILLAGTFSNVNHQASLGVARLLPNGQIDPGFRSGLVHLQYARPLALALQSDGKILLGGQGAYYGAGAPPVGEFRNQLCRLNPDGSWDATFETSGGAANAGYVENVRKIVVQPDDRIVICGALARWGNVQRNAIARLLPNGALDRSFDPGAGPEGNLWSFDLLPDGRFLVAGGFQRFNGVAVPNLARLNSNGSVDEGYYPPRMNLVRDVAVLPDGGSFVAGSFSAGPFTPPLGQARISTRPWTHPINGSTAILPTYEYEAVCPGHPAVPETLSGDVCGLPYAWLNGIMRLQNEGFALEAPSIYSQPEGIVSLTEGSAHTLFAGARSGWAGDVALNYQWRKDGVDIPGATRPVLRLDRLTKATAGIYTVRIWNDLGTVVSQDTVVKILPAATPHGQIRISPETKTFTWILNPKAGQEFTQQEWNGVELQASDDLRQWVSIPNAAQVVDGNAVLTDPNAVAGKRFYRFVAASKLLLPAATADGATHMALTDVPAPIRQWAERHIQAFVDVPLNRRGESEADWYGVSFAPQARQVFDPAYQDGKMPAYAELKVILTSKPAEARGYILVSLTGEDSPVVEFATRGPTKTERLLREQPSGTVTKFMRFSRGFMVGEDASGQPVVQLGTAPLKLMGAAPHDPRERRSGSFDSASLLRGGSTAMSGNWVPYENYEEMKLGMRVDPLRQQARKLRASEAASRWKARSTSRTPSLTLAPGESKVFLADQSIVRVELIDEATPSIQVRLARGGGFEATGLAPGSDLVRVETLDGKAERYTVTVRTIGARRLGLMNGGCEHTKTESFVAGQGFQTDQCHYDQMADHNHPNWCPAVGCGPTALAMLFGWWDRTRGVPGLFYTLDQGRGQAMEFRFNLESLQKSDAPQDLVNVDDRGKIIALYEDLHELCNTVCLAGSGATAPDQMVGAFQEYLFRVAAPYLPSPMNEFGAGFVGYHFDRSYVWPGGMTDWEGGGKMVAQGLRLDQGGGEGRPGIVGFDWHYALAYGYKRTDYYEGCGADKELVDTERWFRCNMGWEDQAEWHDATDVWFGLTAHFWQLNVAGRIDFPDLTSESFQALLGTARRTEVRRPAAAMTANGARLFLIEADNHGHTPTPFNRLGSADGGASFVAPLLPAIGAGVFRSGPALAATVDGQLQYVFGLGLDKRFWRTISFDGGRNWQASWAPFGPHRLFKSAPAATASFDLKKIHVAGLSTDDAYYALTSETQGASWPQFYRPLGGSFKSAPAVSCSLNGQKVHVFGLGTDDRFWRAYSVDGGTNWAGWWPIGEGTFTSAPAAAMNFDGQIIHLFGRGTDYRFWRYMSLDGGANWHGPAQVPDGVFTSGPAVVTTTDGKGIHLFGRGTEPLVPEGALPDPSQPRIWHAYSSDGGETWPGSFGEIMPAVE